MNDVPEKVAKRLSGRIVIGDKIAAEGELSDIENGPGFFDMPCPGSAPHGMSIFGSEEDPSYIRAFCEGSNVEFYTPAEDRITVKYGGKIKLEYWVTEEALQEYGVDLEDYKPFVEKLREMGLTVRIEPGGGAE